MHSCVATGTITRAELRYRVEYVHSCVTTGTIILGNVCFNHLIWAQNPSHLQESKTDELISDGEPELVVCVAAALRRGMLDEGEASKNGIDGNNIHPAFRISGLGVDSSDDGLLVLESIIRPVVSVLIPLIMDY